MLQYVKSDIIECGSYWDRFNELDLLAKSSKGIVYAGECKWKNHKINTSILNKLKKKVEIMGIEADYYVLFSKSGFSNELLKLKDKNVILFDLQKFKELFCLT